MASNKNTNIDDEEDDENEASNDSNPFSFKQFLNKNSETTQRPEQNPLSFKHFINNDSSINKQQQTQSILIPSPPSPPLPPPPPTPPHLIKVSNSKLPDFVNESLLKNDFSPINITATNENPYQFLDSIPKLNTKIAVSDDDDDDNYETRNAMSSYFDLETNLNDSKIVDNEQSSLAQEAFKLYDLNIPEIKQDPIQNLKKKLKDKQQIINDQSTHIKQLEKTIKDLKQKEVNENKALESIIQQVEQNLVKTTERAVESERNADKLKQELKQAKIQLVNLNAENQMLRNAQLKRDDNKLAQFSTQINSAATQAEQTLKQLLTGVDTLRLIASSIESFDKITDITN